MFKPQAILFDLDGTLVDSIPDLAAATRAMLAELGEPTRSDEEISRFVGKGLGVLVERALCMDRAPRSAEDLARAFEIFRGHYARSNGQHTTVYPGVRETLPVLKAAGFPCAVVTNKAAEFTEPLLRMLGLADYFECVVSGDTLPQKKPDPEPLIHACTQLGGAPAASLMVGDSGNDSLAARRAGIPVWLLTCGYSEGQAVDTLDSDGLLSGFAELLPRLGLSSH